MSEFTNLQTYRRYSTFEELLTPQHVIYTFILLFFFSCVLPVIIACPDETLTFFPFYLPLSSLPPRYNVSQVDLVSDVTCARTCVYAYVYLCMCRVYFHV